MQEIVPATREEQQERVAALADALDSGEYKQGRRRLRYVTPEGEVLNCCLGVACEVFRLRTGEGEWVRSREGNDDPGEAGTVMAFSLPGQVREGLILPAQVARWYGFEAGIRSIHGGGSLPENPALRARDGSVMYATYLNDSEHKTFPQIAEAFRATYVTGEPPQPDPAG